MRHVDPRGPSIGLPRPIAILLAAEGVVLIGIAVGFVLYGLGIVHDPKHAHESPVSDVVSVGICLSVGLWFVLSLRVRVGITDDELIIQNRTRTYRIARQSITKIQATDDARYVEYRDGERLRKVDSDASQGYLQMSLFNRKGRSKHVADNLNDWRISGDASQYR